MNISLLTYGSVQFEELLKELNKVSTIVGKTNVTQLEKINENEFEHLLQLFKTSLVNYCQQYLSNICCKIRKSHEFIFQRQPIVVDENDPIKEGALHDTIGAIDNRYVKEISSVVLECSFSIKKIKRDKVTLSIHRDNKGWVKNRLKLAKHWVARSRDEENVRESYPYY